MTIPSSLPRPLGLALLLLAGSASAQFRPPPMTEAERIVIKADEARVEANKALVDKNKARAKDRFQAALARYEEALKLDPHLASAAEGIGECGTALGDHARVADTLLPYVKDHPSDITAAYHAGVALLKLRRFAEGVPLLERVSSKHRPEHYLAHYYLGRYYLYEQRADPAIAEFNGYLSQRPEKLAANDHEVLLLLGHAYLYNREGAFAREAFQRGQKGRPEDLNFQMGVAASYELEARYKDAVKLLEGLGARFPQAPEPRERLGWLMLQNGDLPKAEQSARVALDLKQSAGGWHLMGEVKLAQKKPADAEKHLRKALELGPTLEPARFALARAIQLQGRNDESIALLEEARRNGLNSVDLWATLGSVYRRAGRYQEAIEAHRKVVEAVPTLARGYILIGADRYATGEWDEAIAEYTRALQHESTHPVAKHWLAMSLTQRARVLARREQLGDAARDLRRAFDLERTAPVARSLGSVLMTQKAWAEAVEVLSRGVKLSGASWQEHMLHGYALLGDGKPSEAVAAFETAARMTQDRVQVSDI
ncbi:MAG: tetratricopeptide repeat protein [Myxococcaceae bacterium]